MEFSGLERPARAWDNQRPMKSWKRVAGAKAVGLFAMVSLSCAGGAVEGPKAPGWEPKGATKCYVKASQRKPLVVEWRGEDRAELETQARKGLVVVRYDGCEMEVLTGCKGPGQYEYAANNPQKSMESIRNDDELYAALPVGAARLEGKLRQYGELNVKMTMVGRWEASNTEVRKSELEGAECERATHVITGMAVGAFTFFAGAASEDSGGARVAGAGAGAKGSRGREELSEAGDLTQCDKASDRNKEPVENCSAVIRVEVAELGDVQPSGQVGPIRTAAPAAPTPSPARGSPAPVASSSCPAGMAWIEGGTFQMGSDDGESDEKPVHAVAVRGFCMDETEVTVEAYARCVSAGSCTKPNTGWNCNWDRSAKGKHPINCVNWHQAEAYCKWAGKRLPTEEEWEYAARGTDGRKYPWGNEEPRSQLCWRRFVGTCAVGSYASGDSPFGLHDMAGNVWEWTSSGYSEDHSKSRADTYRVHRGGSWIIFGASAVRAANRGRSGPTHRDSDFGFRCAR